MSAPTAELPPDEAGKEEQGEPKGKAPKAKYTALSKGSQKKRRPGENDHMKLRLNNKHKFFSDQQMEILNSDRFQGDGGEYGQPKQLLFARRDQESLRSPTGFPLTERKNQLCSVRERPIESARGVQFTPNQLKSQSAMKVRRTLSMNDYKQFKYIEDIQEKYEFGTMLGKGAFGQVLRCKHRDSGS